MPQSRAAKTSASGPAAGSLRSRKKDKTRRALLDTAERLFHEKGYEATTLDEICEQAEISLRTFFRYFESKRDLALYDSLRNIGRLRELLGRVHDPVEVLRELEALYDFMAVELEHDKRARTRLDILLNEPALAARSAMLDLDTETRIAHALAAGGGKERGQAARFAAILIVGGARNALFEWITHKGNVSLRGGISAVFAAVRRSGLVSAQ
ncbi:MAG TPA: TetR family transcriptional regulator [Rhizomicrobium sp.]